MKITKNTFFSRIQSLKIIYQGENIFQLKPENICLGYLLKRKTVFPDLARFS